MAAGPRTPSPRGLWGVAILIEVVALLAAAMMVRWPATMPDRWTAGAFLVLAAFLSAGVARQAWRAAPARPLAWAVGVATVLLLWLAFAFAWAGL